MKYVILRPDMASVTAMRDGSTDLLPDAARSAGSAAIVRATADRRVLRSGSVPVELDEPRSLIRLPRRR